jgi:hypothetical protein
MKYLLLIPVILLITNCKSGPQITVCVSTPSINGFDCYNEATQQSSTVLYADSDKYVAMSPGDAQALLNYCGVPGPVADQIKQVNVAAMADQIQQMAE